MRCLSAPLDAQIEITGLCNQRCSHCYNFWRHNAKKKEAKNNELSEEMFLKIIKDLGEAGIYNLTVTGGEPLLQKNITLRVISKAKDLGMDVGLNTNAVLLDEKLAKELSKAGLDRVLISILGVEKTHDKITNLHGAFKKACHGLELLNDTNISVSVNMVVTKHNQSEIAQVGKQMKKLGVKTFCATPMVPSCRGNMPLMIDPRECKEALSELILLEKELSLNIDILEPLPRCLFAPDEDERYGRFFGNRLCSAGVSTCAISAQGMVRPCIHADISYGDITKENFKTIWERMDLWRRPGILPSECQECTAIQQCQGGCRMSAKIFAGKYNGRDAYMTRKITNSKRVTRFRYANLADKSTQAADDDVFIVDSSIRIRKESFGGAFSIHGKISFLTQTGINTIERLKTLGNFTVKNASENLGIDTSTSQNMLNAFIATGLIVRNNKKGGKI